MKPYSDSSLYRKSLKNIFLFCLILIFNTFLAYAQEGIPRINDARIKDTLTSDSVKVSLPKERLEDVLKTKADSERHDFPKNMTFLYKNAEVVYQNMTIRADYISINKTTGEVFARGQEDANGKITKPALAIQDGKTYEYDQFRYDIESKQILATGARTEESEGLIVAEKTKKADENTYYMRRGIYTTDEYFLKKKDSLADYHLAASAIKLIKKKDNTQVITGPIQLYIEQVPTPLVLPFAFLPLASKRSAGILIPSFGERQDVGFFLNGLGYYQPIGQHFDLKILTDVFTKGSWNIRPEVNYKKNYRYSGNFTGEVGNTVRGIKGLDDYSKSRTYRISWRHQQDPKANPLFNFSASVDIVSNKFYNNTINNAYILGRNVLNTQQNSSISLTKRFLTLPFTITAAGYFNQNFATGLTNLRLPQVNLAMTQIYIVPDKDGSRTGLWENLTLNTNVNLSNSAQVLQKDLFTNTMWKDMKTGLKNDISLATNSTIAKFFTLSLTSNINNGLTTKQLYRYYDGATKKVVDTYQNKITGFTSFGLGASLQTILYGMLKFNAKSPVLALRHMVSPSIGFSFAPDFSSSFFGYYKNYLNERGELTPYSIFEGSEIGGPGMGRTGSINFNINNNIEMKVRDKKDSTGVRKVKLFESLNVNFNYNFAAAKYRWSTFQVSAQNSFFNNQLNVNSSLVLEPYEIIFPQGSNVGIRTENFGKFSLQGFNAQLSYSLNNSLFKNKNAQEKKYNRKGTIRNEVYSFDEDGFAHFDQPWNLSLNAQYSYSKSTSLFGTKSASIGLDGNIKLTPYWAITGSTYYDVMNNELGYTRLGFSRDQRSFTINFNWVPFGRYKLYDFFIGIKANILRDALKYKDQSFPQNDAPF